MPVPNDKRGLKSAAVILFSVAKIGGGVFLIAGQFLFAPRGTLYGFFLPQNMHDVFANLQTIFLFVVAVRLIWDGIWGDKTKGKAD